MAEPTWKTDHPVHEPDRKTRAHAYSEGATYVCVTRGCGTEKTLPESPVDGPVRIRTGCPECETITEHERWSSPARAYSVFRQSGGERR